MKGLTGPIEFKEGERTQFKLDLLKLKAKGLVKVGEWSPSKGISISNEEVFFYPIDTNVTLVVTTILVQHRLYLEYLSLYKKKKKLTICCYFCRNNLTSC